MTFAARAFNVQGPTLWNLLLPNYIKQSSSLSVFKKNLQTHLFKAYYC